MFLSHAVAPAGETGLEEVCKVRLKVVSRLRCFYGHIASGSIILLNILADTYTNIHVSSNTMRIIS